MTAELKNISWAEKDETPAGKLISAVKVYVTNMIKNEDSRSLRLDSEEFIFSIYNKNNKVTLHFEGEDEYIEFIKRHGEELVYSLSESPLLFRNALDFTDFTANQSDEPELYYIISGMIQEKLFHIERDISLGY